MQYTKNLSSRTKAEIEAVLQGKKKNWRFFLLPFGPALIAAIAYIDPGNYATNIEAGASYGYALLWVVFCANIIAMLFQSLSAKLGIVTGLNLPQVCHREFSPWVNWSLWIASELCAIATDLAEFLGGAIGFSLLFHLPLLVGMLITAVLTYAVLMLENKGFRPIEIVIAVALGLVCVCFLAELLIAPVDWGAVGLHIFKPELVDRHAVFLAVGIVGATVMPHAIYLHSALMPQRADAQNDQQKARLIKWSNWEVGIGLALAGSVNMAMVIMAASVFHQGHSDIAEIETAYSTLYPLLGSAAAGFYLFSLMVSGVSSSVVGTMAGQIIMQGFVGFKIPLLVRRLVTMLPAFIVVWAGVNSTQALLVSQVILSLVLPVPMTTLLIFTGSKRIMGKFANHRVLHMIAIFCAALILGLNFVLLYLTLTGN